VVDLGVTPAGVPYLVMELVDGAPLSAAIASGPMPVERVLRIARDLASGLAYAHERGFVHRDVKPSNVMLVPTDGGEVAKLLDFGVVEASRTALDATKLTQTGVTLGTPVYMAPEQMGGGDVSPLADVYALGATLFASTEGKPPFAGDALEIASQKTRGPPVPRPAGGLEHLVRWMLAPRPSARPSAREVLRVVERMLAGERVEVSTESMLAAAGIRGWRRPGIFAASTLALVLAVIGLQPRPGSIAVDPLNIAPDAAITSAPAPAEPSPAAASPASPTSKRRVAAVATARPAEAPPGGQDRSSPNARGHANVVIRASSGLHAGAVFVDGRHYGEAPLRIELGSGEHLILVRRTDGSSASRTIAIRPGETERVVFRME